MLFAEIFAPRFCYSCFSLLSDCYLCQPCFNANGAALAATCISCDRRRPYDQTCLTPCCDRAPTTLWSLGHYEQPALAQLITLGKFTGAYDCFHWFGQQLGHQLQAVASLLAKATLVPIPLRPEDERRRGFNQSLIMAKAISQQLNLPVLPCLTKIRSTRPQRELNRDQRTENIREAFAVTGDVPPFVVLVDDVKTTGATLREAGRVLRQAGAKTVLAITIAR